MAVAMPVRCIAIGHALVGRVEVQVGVRPKRTALSELPLLLRRVCVECGAAALAMHVLVLVPQQVPGEVGRCARSDEERAGIHIYAYAYVCICAWGVGGGRVGARLEGALVEGVLVKGAA